MAAHAVSLCILWDAIALRLPSDEALPKPDPDEVREIFLGLVERLGFGEPDAAAQFADIVRRQSR